MVNQAPITLDVEAEVEAPVPPEEQAMLPATPRNENHRTGISHRRRFNVSRDIFLAAIADLPEEERETLRWFYDHLDRSNVPRSEFGKVLRKDDGIFYSADSILAIMTGGRMRRKENIQPVLQAIEKLRAVESLRTGQVKSGFIETRLYRLIERTILKALKRNKVAFFWGDSQIGKTEAFLEFARRLPGQTVYVEVPTGGSLGPFLLALARTLNLPFTGKVANLMERIMDCFDPATVLLVDEAHRALLQRSRSKAPGVFDFLRELYNRRKCTIAVAMTNEGRDQFLYGQHAKSLQQLWRRRGGVRQLPSSVPDDDAALFADAYGLACATDEKLTIRVSYYDERTGNERTRTMSDSPLRLQREVLAVEGLGVWISILQEAADMAQEQGKQVTWGAVIKARALSLADETVE